MALYVAVCLIAALTALQNVTAVPGHILGLVWGTTVGLAVAHVFAFRIAGRLVHEGVLPMADRIVSVVQLAGAAAVAVLVSVPVLLVPPAYELAWAGYTCAAIIGVVGYFVARGAARAAESVPCCSAWQCSSLLSPSPRSNTGWRITSRCPDPPPQTAAPC
jgi:hypothetical protein